MEEDIPVTPIPLRKAKSLHHQDRVAAESPQPLRKARSLREQNGRPEARWGAGPEAQNIRDAYGPPLVESDRRLRSQYRRYARKTTITIPRVYLPPTEWADLRARKTVNLYADHKKRDFKTDSVGSYILVGASPGGRRQNRSVPLLKVYAL